MILNLTANEKLVVSGAIDNVWCHCEFLSEIPVSTEWYKILGNEAAEKVCDAICCNKNYTFAWGLYYDPANNYPIARKLCPEKIRPPISQTLLLAHRDSCCNIL